ncbi:hypothetical protein T10_12824 [Trichinella papuae]|uniref:Uncharacterized protein n=1 Tax=Trichinella papuae TaxID=268474 RepID=A0A0V1MN70_9BILA|nr:hypothetical protein T10_12824 [Trichinella papuae]
MFHKSTIQNSVAIFTITVHRIADQNKVRFYMKYLQLNKLMNKTEFHEEPWFSMLYMTCAYGKYPSQRQTGETNIYQTICKL